MGKYTHIATGKNIYIDGKLKLYSLCSKLMYPKNFVVGKKVCPTCKKRFKQQIEKRPKRYSNKTISTFIKEEDA